MLIIQLSALLKTSLNKFDESVPELLQKELKDVISIKELFNSAFWQKTCPSVYTQSISCDNTATWCVTGEHAGAHYGIKKNSFFWSGLWRIQSLSQEHHWGGNTLWMGHTSIHTYSNTPRRNLVSPIHSLAYFGMPLVSSLLAKTKNKKKSMSLQKWNDATLNQWWCNRNNRTHDSYTYNLFRHELKNRE